MPRPAPVEPDVRRAAVSQLQRVLPALLAAFRARDDLELCESLPIVRLGERELHREGTLRNLVRSTSDVHHQIRARGASVAYARSRVDATGSRLASVGASDERVRALEEAIRALDALAGVREESDTYLLEVPSHRVIALWTQDRDRDVLSIVASGGLDLRPGQVLEGEALLDRLRRMPPVGGIAAGREAPGR